MKQDYWDQILLEAARKDDHYQKLLRACREAEAEYTAIRDSLPAEQAEQLERYSSLCEELQHRLTTLACQIPREL